MQLLRAVLIVLNDNRINNKRFHDCFSCSKSLSKIGRITSTTRQFVNHMGFQITGEGRPKGGKSGFFPGR